LEQFDSGHSNIVGDRGGGLAGSDFIFLPEASSSEPGGFFLLLELESERGGANEVGVGEDVPLRLELLLLVHLLVPLLRSLL